MMPTKPTGRKPANPAPKKQAPKPPAPRTSAAKSAGRMIGGLATSRANAKSPTKNTYSGNDQRKIPKTADPMFSRRETFAENTKPKPKPMTAAQKKASTGRSVVTGKGYPKHDPLPPPGRKPGSGPAKTTADPRRSNGGAVLPKQRLEYTSAATATAKPTSRKSTAAEPTRRIVKSNYVVNRPIPKAKPGRGVSATGSTKKK